MVRRNASAASSTRPSENSAVPRLMCGFGNIGAELDEASIRRDRFLPPLDALQRQPKPEPRFGQIIFDLQRTLVNRDRLLSPPHPCQRLSQTCLNIRGLRLRRRRPADQINRGLEIPLLNRQHAQALQGPSIRRLGFKNFPIQSLGFDRPSRAVVIHRLFECPLHRHGVKLQVMCGKPQAKESKTPWA